MSTWTLNETCALDARLTTSAVLDILLSLLRSIAFVCESIYLSYDARAATFSSLVSSLAHSLHPAVNAGRCGPDTKDFVWEACFRRRNVPIHQYYI